MLAPFGQNILTKCPSWYPSNVGHTPESPFLHCCYFCVNKGWDPVDSSPWCSVISVPFSAPNCWFAAKWTVAGPLKNSANYLATFSAEESALNRLILAQMLPTGG